ncbi:hypothetical protein TNCT_276551 [Trichonephila clavata]|uniref:Uncharacterized protein n=1 Tax=Trichonephila clavata TaxID=2740835 RepID=A0A8X6LR53_TRICU|nr:hypothetical protein TNCT_276551 [Trichonephila clavata]
MAFCSDQPIDMDFQNVSLPTSGISTSESPVDPTPCAKFQVIKADIKRYSLIVKGYENMILSLRQSNARDEHDPMFVEITRQLTIYEDLLEKSVSEFGSLPYCNTPGCPVPETPTSSPLKTQSAKRKDEEGYISPPQRKIIQKIYL